MLKRLPKSTDPEEIEAELLHLVYLLRAVKQLIKKENNCEIKLPLYALELENNETAREIYNIKRLMYTVVSVESYRPCSGLKQCFKCQRFNHTFAGCNLSARCVICAGGHSHKDCPVRQVARTDPSKLKWSNCEETGHPASYRGCVSYKAAQENFEKPKKQEEGRGKQKPMPRSFTSKKVTDGMSFSSAVANQAKPTPSMATPAQNRLLNTAVQEQPNLANLSSNMAELVNNLSPMLTCLGSPIERFMLLSKLVEMCFVNKG